MALNNNNSSSHNNIAARYMDMVSTFNSLLPVYVRYVPRNQSASSYPAAVMGTPYLVTHLTHWVNSKVVAQPVLRTGGTHRVMTASGSDGRRSLPSTIRSGINDLLPPAQQLWNAEKVEVKWVACYLANIVPDKTAPNWQRFECSHRCIEYGLVGQNCIDSGCLTWESKSVNQSRGNTFCMKPCNHPGCGAFICHCQGFHQPPCL
jgi:hypothetical protein